MNDSGIHPEWADAPNVVRLDERRRRKTWPAPSQDAPPAPPADEEADAIKSQGGNA